MSLWVILKDLWISLQQEELLEQDLEELAALKSLPDVWIELRHLLLPLELKVLPVCTYTYVWVSMYKQMEDLDMHVQCG